MMYEFIVFIHLVSSKKLCHKYLIRKEIRDMTNDEWIKYKNAVMKLREEGVFDELSQIHNTVAAYAHNHPRFLPWHRMFLLYFESMLQFFSNDQSISVPYWDWTIDCEDPSKSIIFDEKYWGGKICFEVGYPEKHCLARNENDIDPFYSMAQINKIINRKMKYDEFRDILELVPHAIVHFNVGGKKGDMAMMYSTNDPIFWHHHSFIDYLWHKKQAKNLKSYENNGNETLFPFDKQIKDVLDINDCCIKYKEYKPFKINSKGEGKASRLSEEFIKRHGYDSKKVRMYEDYLISETKKRNIIYRFIKYIWDKIFFWI
ncbi:Tyrosinase [Astathelohania contejeani]|uniref:Tyrosinase n=1 Tax=Astathelohania contejeani TaxID=164912 RepID=A0ABQ7HXA7_9MICR|nr:Tyrosinase [Thelohania contejeani]